MPSMGMLRTRSVMKRRAVLLAAGSSCAVVAASAFGVFTAPVVVTALGMAGVIAAVSLRDSRSLAPPQIATRLADEYGPIVIAAPKAAAVAPPATGHTDAA